MDTVSPQSLTLSRVEEQIVPIFEDPIRDEPENDDQELKTWGEVDSVQKALKPYIQCFARITGRTLPILSLWRSVAWHVRIWQKHSDDYWRMDDRAGTPPDLAELVGQIPSSEIEPDAAVMSLTKDYTHPTLRGVRPRVGSLLWYEETYHGQILRGAVVMNQEEMGIEAGGQGSSDFQAVLDSSVAQDLARYSSWLSYLGYGYYKKHVTQLSWESWRDWYAPTTFIAHSPPNRMENVQIERDLAAVPLSSSDRPTVTLEEARKGHEAFLVSRNVRSL